MRILLWLGSGAVTRRTEGARKGVSTGNMDEDDVWEPDLVERPEVVIPVEIIAGLVEHGWRRRVSDLEPVVLEAFWQEALAYARWEIGRYGRWREQDRPVLADGYDAEGVVQAAFARLLSREAEGVPIFYTADGLRGELRALVKHRVRWLHERKETGLLVSEWDVLMPRADGELVSIVDYLPAGIARPDEELMQKEEGELLGEFKAGFEKTLGKRQQLVEVFRWVWAGEKRREVARRLGMGVERIKTLQKEVNRRLLRFAAQARGGGGRDARDVQEVLRCRALMLLPKSQGTIVKCMLRSLLRTDPLTLGATSHEDPSQVRGSGGLAAGVGAGDQGELE